MPFLGDIFDNLVLPEKGGDGPSQILLPFFTKREEAVPMFFPFCKTTLGYFYNLILSMDLD